MPRGSSAIIPAAVLAAAAIVQAWPQAQSALEFDRAGIVAGQWWRLVTGNLVHFGWPHLLADAAAFAGLCWAARRRRLGLAWPLAASLPAVGLAVFLWAGNVATYRGLSGVDSALLSAVLLDMALADANARSFVWLGLWAAMAARAAFETATGRPVLPCSLPEGVLVVGAAHVAGLAAGAIVAALGAAARCRPARPDRWPWARSPCGAGGKATRPGRAPGPGPRGVRRFPGLPGRRKGPNIKSNAAFSDLTK